MRYDIITVGSAVVDTFIDTNKKSRNGILEIPANSKMLVDEPGIFTGGGGTNCAVGFSRLGLKTGYLGKIGNDSNGALILHDLEKEKVDFLGKIDSSKSGFSIILDSENGDRAVFNYRGPNDNLEYNDFDIKKLKTKWFYFGPANSKTLHCQEKIAEYCSKNEIKIAINPSLHDGEIDSKLHSIVKRADIVIMNREEAKIFVKDNFLKRIFRLGPKIVCITNGDEELEVYDGVFKYSCKPYKVKVKETTGAGDAFATGFVYGILTFNDIEEAIKIGLVNSESCIQEYGAKNGLLNWNQIKSRIEKIKIKKEAHL